MTDSNETPLRLPVRQMRDEPAPQRAAQEGDLPPLPKLDVWGLDQYGSPTRGGLSPEKVREYARTAIAAAGGGVPPTEAQIDEYIDGYVLEGDNGFHVPVEHERLMIKDAIMGLIAEHWASSPQPEAAPQCTRSHPHENMDGFCQLRTEIARLTNENARLKAAPAVAQVENVAEDAYNHACDEMERWQRKRRASGKSVGTTGSLCDGIAWLYGYIDEIEAKLAAPEAPAQAAPSAGEVDRTNLVLAMLHNAMARMDRARNILTNGKPTHDCNWGMLDSSDLRAALSHKGQP